MKYKVLKDVPGYNKGQIIDADDKELYQGKLGAYPDFFEHIPDKPKTIFDLKEGDEYYFINSCGEIWKFFNNCERDKNTINQGNAFLTKREAELELRRRTLLASLLKKKHEGGYGKKWVEGEKNWWICFTKGSVTVTYYESYFIDSSLGFFNGLCYTFIEENETELTEYFNILMKINEAQ